MTREQIVEVMARGLWDIPEEADPVDRLHDAPQRILTALEQAGYVVVPRPLEMGRIDDIDREIIRLGDRCGADVARYLLSFHDAMRSASPTNGKG